MTGRLIAFTGPAGCGKSTAAEALVEMGWARVKFADPLKNMLRALYYSCGIEDTAFIEARIEGEMKEEPDPLLRGRTPRWALQTLGTEWGRNLISEDLWTAAWRNKVNGLLAEGVDVVADDCRFPNEAEAVRRLGGKVVQILGRCAGIGGRHASERMEIDPDMKIANAATIEGFQTDVIYVFHCRRPE